MTGNTILKNFAILISWVAAITISVSAETAVQYHGALQVNGTQILNQHNEPAALHGMSFFWSNWQSKYFTSGVVNTLASDWNANVVRATLAVGTGDADNPDYLLDSAANMNRIKTVINAAIANGIYVIVDYHSHSADQTKSNAIRFFQAIAKDYKNYDNIIYEIFNEPIEQSWSTVKSYSVNVIAAIRNAGANNLILVGSPHWDQDVDVASEDLITGYSNIAYTLHFYAGTHGSSLRDRAETAMANGAAIFISEWGTSLADGSDGPYISAADEWLQWADDFNLSWCNWAISDKEEGASALLPDADANGSWSSADLTVAGRYVQAAILARNPSQNAYGSSSSSNANSSSSSNSAVTASLIEDLEDGDEVTLWNGFWYTYNDNDAGGNSTINPNTDMAPLVPISGGPTGSSYTAKFTYKLDSADLEYQAFVGTGIKLQYDQEPVDLTSCTQIQYDYKGAAHRFRAEGSNVGDADYHGTSKAYASAWTTARISWSSLAQEGWGASEVLDKSSMVSFSWQIQDNDGTSGTLWLDNVRCLNAQLPAQPPVSSSSSIVSSSSSSATSSSSVVLSSSSIVASSSSAVIQIWDPSLEDNMNPIGTIATASELYNFSSYGWEGTSYKYTAQARWDTLRVYTSTWTGGGVGFDITYKNTTDRLDSWEGLCLSYTADHDGMYLAVGLNEPDALVYDLPRSANPYTIWVPFAQMTLPSNTSYTRAGLIRSIKKIHLRTPKNTEGNYTTGLHGIGLTHNLSDCQTMFPAANSQSSSSVASSSSGTPASSSSTVSSSSGTPASSSSTVSSSSGTPASSSSTVSSSSGTPASSSSTVSSSSGTPASSSSTVSSSSGTPASSSSVASSSSGTTDDDGNNSLETAQKIALNTPFSDLPLHVEDNDYYRFTTPEEGTLRIELDGPTGGDTYLELLDATGEVLASNDDQSAFSLYSSISTEPVAKGTYYLHVVNLGTSSLNGYSLIANYTAMTSTKALTLTQRPSIRATSHHLVVTGLRCEQVEIQILDMQGKMVRHLYTGPSTTYMEFNWNTSEHPKGLYLIQVIEDKHRRFHQVITDSN